MAVTERKAERHAVAKIHTLTDTHKHKRSRRTYGTGAKHSWNAISKESQSRVHITQTGVLRTVPNGMGSKERNEIKNN